MYGPGPFLVPLREAGVRTILELGCGTGHDAARLAGEGYAVTAADISGEAIGQATGHPGLDGPVHGGRHDPGAILLPYGDFDAVMSNDANAHVS